MTIAEAIENLKELREFALGFMFEESPEIGAVEEAINALKVRQRLEEAIAKMERSGTFAGSVIHYTALKAILGEEK